MKLEIQAVCHKGLVRENNEDAVSVGGYLLRDDTIDLRVSTSEEGVFYLLVSDGMGGHEMGEEASRYTLERIREQFQAHLVRPDSLEEDLRETVSDISAKLNRRGLELGQSHPMGCTLTGVVWSYGHIWLLNAGDSRTYRFREGLLRQLTTDETERGITGNPQAGKLLLNCIGGGSEGRLTVEKLDGKLLDGDMLLLCSDGLTDMVSEEEIESSLERGEEAADLLRKACDAGGADNISLVLAKVSDL